MCGCVWRGRVTWQVWERAKLRSLHQPQQGDLLLWTETCIFQHSRHWVLHSGLPVCKAKLRFRQEVSICCFSPSPARTLAASEISRPLHTTQMGHSSFGFYILGPAPHCCQQWILAILFNAALSANSTLSTRHKHATTQLSPAPDACPVS